MRCCKCRLWRLLSAGVNGLSNTRVGRCRRSKFCRSFNSYLLTVVDTNCSEGERKGSKMKAVSILLVLWLIVSSVYALDVVIPMDANVFIGTWYVDVNEDVNAPLIGVTWSTVGQTCLLTAYNLPAGFSFIQGVNDVNVVGYRLPDSYDYDVRLRQLVDANGVVGIGYLRGRSSVAGNYMLIIKVSSRYGMINHYEALKLVIRDREPAIF